MLSQVIHYFHKYIQKFIDKLSVMKRSLCVKHLCVTTCQALFFKLRILKSIISFL